jgi:hypothetical protein
MGADPGQPFWERRYILATLTCRQSLAEPGAPPPFSPDVQAGVALFLYAWIMVDQIHVSQFKLSAFDWEIDLDAR